jgi:hypothetical protein
MGGAIMRTYRCAIISIGCLMIGSAASPACGGVTATAATVDAGGGRISGAAISIDGSLSSFGDIVSTSSPATVVRQGYIGQLTEVTNLTVTAAPATVNEGGSAQLQATAGLGDATISLIDGSEITWSAPAFPVTGIGASGVATAAWVYANVSGLVTGRYADASGAGLLRVLDTVPDNFGLYGGDGLPDGWQVAYFGVENPQGTPNSDPDHDGAGNDREYMADTDPTNSASYFRIVCFSNLPPSRYVWFTSSTNRLYTLEWRTNLLSGTWAGVAEAIDTPGNGGTRWLRDTNAAGGARFYRVGARAP